MTVTSAPSRLQLVEVTRKLLLNEGGKFSLTSITKELGCSRAYIRRFFPTKADLVSAAFGENVEDEVVIPKIDVAAENKTPSENLGARDDWVMRRFRVFERAIATLESEIECVRKDNTKSVAELEKKLFVKASKGSNSAPQPCSSSTNLTEAAADLHVPNEQDPATYLAAGRMPENSPGCNFLNKSPSVRATSNQLPPRNHVGEVDVVEFLGKSPMAPDVESRDPLFITAPADVAIQKDGFKEIAVFGLTAFVTALLLAIIVIAFTNIAGASYIPPDGINKTAAQQRIKIGPQSGIFGSKSQLVIDATGSAAPPSGPTTLGTKSLALQNFNIGRVTLNEAGRIEPEAKVKIALAYLKGDGVRADPMTGAIWSEAAAQQGNADAQYILGTLYSEGIKPDVEQAFRWFSSAAVLGNPKAMHNLAIALLNGAGVAKDKASAVNWFVRAANLGYRDSAFDLGVLYERGEGVAQNSHIALSWYDTAASLGDQQAARRASLLRSNGLENSIRN